MKTTFLYIKISNHIQQLIETGILKPGDKLESVRMFSKQQGISISTAFKAYEELIFRDLVEARQRSGYFVIPKVQNVTPISIPLDEQTTSKPISTSEIISFAQKKSDLKGIVKLSETTPDISLLPITKLNKSMNQALRLSEDSCVNYENVFGNIELRRHIARQSIQWGGVIDQDDIIITQGCNEATVMCLMTVTKPGDIIAIGRPTYFSIYNIIQNLGLRVLEINIHPNEGIDLDSLEKSVKKYDISACVFISNFNNPSGNCFSNTEKKRLVEIITEKNIPLIEDDIYGDIYFENSRPKTCKSFDKKGLVMLCSSFSKTLAPGYRVGWCLPGKFKDRFLEIKLMHTISTASPTQAAIAQFFNSGRYDLHMNKLRKALHINSILYRKAISDYFPKSTRITVPKGGFVLWIELDKKVDSTELFYSALEQGVSMWPGRIFSESEGFNNFIRISFGKPYDDTVEKGLRLLGELIANQDTPANSIVTKT